MRARSGVLLRLLLATTLVLALAIVGVPGDDGLLTQTAAAGPICGPGDLLCEPLFPPVQCLTGVQDCDGPEPV